MTGVFLKRGEYTEPLDKDKDFEFEPIAKPGDKVIAGDWLGEAKENWISHKIMVPFVMEGEYTVKSVVTKRVATKSTIPLP
jgi:V/A-type H+/Na+-transporting ATPase subunit A